MCRPAPSRMNAPDADPAATWATWAGPVGPWSESGRGPLGPAAAPSGPPASADSLGCHATARLAHGLAARRQHAEHADLGLQRYPHTVTNSSAIPPTEPREVYKLHALACSILRCAGSVHVERLIRGRNSAFCEGFSHYDCITEELSIVIPFALSLNLRKVCGSVGSVLVYQIRHYTYIFKIENETFISK